jgi:hypothetical protein
VNKVLIVVMALLALSITAGAAKVTVERDGMLNVNGSRLFVVGSYDNPAEDAELKRLVDAGFNLVRSSSDIGALDRLQQHNVYGWVNTGANIDLSQDTETRQAALQSLAGALNAHPALLVWEVPDEALWNCWYEALTWRSQVEPGELRKHIKDVTDEQERTKLLAQLEQSAALRHAGRDVEAEQLADDLWRQMKLEPPKPGYGLGDAQARAEKMCAGMLAGYNKIKELAGRPVWMNHAPRNQIEQLAAFNQATDIVGCDIYPVPYHQDVGHSDLTNRYPSCVGAYTDRMQQAAPGKPVWMVLQGFGWGDIKPELPEPLRAELRRPTLAETRFMAYDAIVHGARGILYWGSQYVEKNSAFYDSLLSVVAELRDMQSILAAPDAVLNISVSHQPTLGSVDRGIVVLAKAAGNAPWLVAVNEWTGPLSCTLHGLDTLNGTTYRERNTHEEITVVNGTASLIIQGEGVRVLEPVNKR